MLSGTCRVLLYFGEMHAGISINHWVWPISEPLHKKAVLSTPNRTPEMIWINKILIYFGREWGKWVLPHGLIWFSPNQWSEPVHFLQTPTFQCSQLQHYSHQVAGFKKIIEFLLFQLIILTCAEIRKKEYIKKLSDFQSGLLATSFY